MNSSGEKRTININPDIFKISASRTRRRKEPSGDNPLPKLKVRDTQLASRVNKSIKNQVLKYMRDKHRQQERSGAIGSGDKSPTSVVDAFDTDFKQSLDYLNAVAEKQKTQLPKYNATLRNTSTLGNVPYYGDHLRNTNQMIPAIIPTSGDSVNTLNFTHPTSIDSGYARQFPPNRSNNISAETSPEMFRYEPPIQMDSGPLQPELSHPGPLQPQLSRYQPEYPKYGCLKNGSLPTYRMLRNQTMRIDPNHHSSGQQHTQVATQQSATQQPREQESFREWMKDKIGKQKLKEKRTEVEIQKRNVPKFRKLKQKKTVRRTFYLGKSEKQRNVSVLISNKTLRREIANKSHQLKQTPIEDIRKCLIKKGFIKIGSTAPNDVLRKMYESISTLCGDIKNHNSDNIVYNYLNASPTEETF